MSAAERDRFEGWSVVSATALFVAVLSLVILGSLGTGEEGTRCAVRATARTSMLLFSGLYVASALRRLRPSGVADWLVRNQRFLAFALGVSHAAHALFLWRLFTAGYETFDPAGAAGGLIGYGFLVLLLATSNDAARAALGARAWSLLHRVGLHYLWGAFTVTMVGSFVARPGAVPAFFVALGLASLGLRIAGAVSARRGKASASVIAAG